MAYFVNPIIYGGKQPTAEDLKAKMLLEPPVEQLDLKTLGFQVQEGVKSSTVDYSLTAARKVTKRDTGCGPWVPTGDLLTMASNTINVWPLMIQLEECADRFDGTVLESAKKKGHATDNDLSGTVLEEIVREGLSPVVYEDMLRIMLLADRGSSDENYNQVDGLRKQLIAKAVDGKIVRGTDIPSADGITPAEAVAVLEDLYKKQTAQLKNVAKTNKAYYVDEVLYDAIEDARINFGSDTTVLESGKAELFSGSDKPLYYRGILIKKLPQYNQYAQDLPAGQSRHIAFLTVPTTIVVAMDAESDLAEITMWYDIKDRKNYTRVLYRLGVGFAYDKLIVFSL
ncbi:hypothetical protein [Hymenobacter glacieicola]|uniref:Capsid protein n=1 Tax=Hymenobacter glacieicola TaxID=1562124 RepID=A0ABQ1WKM4_9BACT|nr:hypothetical protein [Hymenobacter glacieicola]GGG34216.1 hypothetical protein GCM10011378_08280 [Hymenobacter glacieicola]